MERMTLNEIRKKMNEIRHTSEMIQTNYHLMANHEAQFDVVCGHHTIVFIHYDEGIPRVYYYSGDQAELTFYMNQLPQKSILEIVSKSMASPIPWIENFGWKFYGVYGRFGKKIDIDYQSLIEVEDEGARKTDFQELKKIIVDNFDQKADHLFSDEELLQLIGEQMIRIRRKNGKIVSIVIFQIEGKKLYINLRWNQDDSGVLYKMEMKFRQYAMKQYGINYEYLWINLDNEKAMRRMEGYNPDLYNFIYVKNND